MLMESLMLIQYYLEKPVINQSHNSCNCGHLITKKDNNHTINIIIKTTNTNMTGCL